MLTQITTAEQHFNSLESEYRKLASTWLLAALGACGFILTTRSEKLLFDPWLLVSIICLLGSIGILVLYMLDLRVYHQLLAAFFNSGLQIETENPDWVPPVRIRMMKTHDKGITKRVLYFYFTLTCSLAIIGAVSVWFIEQISETVWPLLLSISTVVVLGMLYWTMKNTAINREAVELFEKFEKSQKRNLEFKIKAINPDDKLLNGSEIRNLLQFPSGSIIHCTLPPGVTSKAVKHITTMEVWYVIAGRGEIWRKLGNDELVEQLTPGTSINLPAGTHFQFRNT